MILLADYLWNFLRIFGKARKSGTTGLAPRRFKYLEKSDNLHDPVNHSGMEGGGWRGRWVL